MYFAEQRIIQGRRREPKTLEFSDVLMTAGYDYSHVMGGLRVNFAEYQVCDGWEDAVREVVSNLRFVLEVFF